MKTNRTLILTLCLLIAASIFFWQPQPQPTHCFYPHDDYETNLFFSTAALYDSVAVPGKPPTVGLDLGPYPSDLQAERTEERFSPMTITGNCTTLRMIEKSNDGFGGNRKWLCNPDSLTRNSVVFSIGSNGDFGFEETIAEICHGCKIFTFDCFSPAPKDKKPSTFVPLCVGSHKDSKFRTLRQLTEIVNVNHIDILKIDAEGAEWDVLPQILNEFRPQQFV